MAGVEIERKEWSARQAARKLRSALHESQMGGKWISATAASGVSGIPMHLCESGLLLLAGELSADVRATPDGEVEFRFEDLSNDPFAFRLHPRLSGFLSRAGRRVSRAGQRFAGLFAGQAIGVAIAVLGLGMLNVLPFNLGIGILILAAVVLFPTIAVLACVVFAVMIGEQFAKDPALAAVIAPFLASLGAVCLAVATKMAGLYQSLFEWGAPWVIALADFGESGRGELEDEARFMQLLRARQGRVTLGDLMVLFGWSRDEAFRQVTRLAVDYEGDIHVDEEGAMTFVFAKFEGRTDNPIPRPVWEVEESPSERLGEDGRKAGLWGMFSWALFASALVVIATTLPGVRLMTMFTERMPGGTATLTVLLALFAAFPLFIGFRAFAIARRTQRFDERQRWLERLRDIVSGGGRIRAPITDVSDEVVLDFDGVIDEASAESGEVTIEFPELMRVSSGGSETR